MLSIAEVHAHFRRLRALAAEALHGYERLAALLQSAAEDLAAREQRMELELARTYLPAFDEQAFTRAETLTGYRGFSRRSPLHALVREEARIHKTINQIEADERFARREALVAELAAERAKADEELWRWQERCERFESLEGFLELVEVKYDTPFFAESWLQARYWRHWKQGDAICEALGMDDFGDDVLPAYRDVARQRDFWRGEVDRLAQESAAVHALVQQRDAAQAQLPELPERFYEQCCAALAEFLHRADSPLLSQWLAREAGDARQIRGALRNLAGLRAKHRYIEEMGGGVAEVIAELQKRVVKYGSKLEKYERPKYAYGTFPSSVLDQKFEATHAKLISRLGELQQLLASIVGYEGYHRFDLSNSPELWWKEMTGKKPPRSMKGLRRFYTSNPKLRLLHVRFDDEEELLVEEQDAEEDDPAAAIVAEAVAQRFADEQEADDDDGEDYVS